MISHVTRLIVCLLTVIVADGRSTTATSGDETMTSPLNTTYGQWQRMRIEAIKQEILSRLGISSVPDVSGISTTVEEHREILRKYRKSVEELQGRTFSPYDKERQHANTFDIFSDSGMTDDCNSHP